jgi:hypothetical protein
MEGSSASAAEKCLTGLIGLLQRLGMTPPIAMEAQRIGRTPPEEIEKVLEPYRGADLT